MTEIPTVSQHLTALVELLYEPQHLDGPDAQRCQACENPEAWAALTTGWSRVLQSAKVIQERHAADAQDPVMVQCADAAREAAVGELRWVWARLVNKFIGEVESDA